MDQLIPHIAQLDKTTHSSDEELTSIPPAKKLKPAQAIVSSSSIFQPPAPTRERSEAAQDQETISSDLTA